MRDHRPVLDPYTMTLVHRPRNPIAHHPQMGMMHPGMMHPGMMLPYGSPGGHPGRRGLNAFERDRLMDPRDYNGRISLYKESIISEEEDYNEKEEIDLIKYDHGTQHHIIMRDMEEKIFR